MHMSIAVCMKISDVDLPCGGGRGTGRPVGGSGGASLALLGGGGGAGLSVDL